MLVLLVTCQIGVTPIRADDGDFVKDRIVLLVEEGTPLSFAVPPNSPHPTGLTGLLSQVKFGPIGSFTTGLKSGGDVTELLEFFLLTQMPLVAGDVLGTFSLPRGQIKDEHEAWLTFSPEPSHFAEEFGLDPALVPVIIVTAEGTIQGGTGKYKDATGTSKLYLKVEVIPPFDNPTILTRTAQFVFEFDKRNEHDDDDN